MLFGLDDGAKDAFEASAMLDALANLGVTTQCITPHQKSGQYLPSAAAIAANFAEVCSRRRQNHPELILGAENMWDEVFVGRLQQEAIPSYGSSRSFLFELPLSALPTGLEATLFKLRVAGWLPVMAHPERYSDLVADLELARRLASQCAFVIDLPALVGYHGRREAKAAKLLVESGLVHAVTTDAHNTLDVARAAEGLSWLRKTKGDHGVQVAFFSNPQAILAGEMPELLS